MTEYELIVAREAILQTINGLADVQASHQAIYLSLVFGYISVAYVAGLKLTKTQCLLGTIAFVVAGSRQVISIGILAYSVADKAAQLSSLTQEDIIVNPEAVIIPSMLVWASGVLIGLLFMWSVRHPREE